ncbi:unnamed protein product [Darwinula stevensoni]|uniref:C-type lectin domain-containing protein n=1 Tax=Darwinula stevensoni TaxID=69355 RepID=A0A7R9FQ99_9CRUS|nr:unnamed protein product [Darwinula stevensoni]CAG0899087.1 unnamed protein product [Darwinula stevensoni]
MSRPEKKSMELCINMRGISCFLFALILLSKYGSGNALESTPIHGRENNGGNLEKMVLVLLEDKESLRNDNRKLKYEFENMRRTTEKLSNDYEKMRKDHENLKSSFQEHLRERDKLQLNTTDARLQYLEAISLQIGSKMSSISDKEDILETTSDKQTRYGRAFGAPLPWIKRRSTKTNNFLSYENNSNKKSTFRVAVNACFRLRIDRVSFQYDCFSSALKIGNIHYAWWVDRHGEPQYYWDGSKAGQHICNCGLSGNCTDTNFPCNCDAKPPHWESDSGAITNATSLPITELRFGGLQFEGQKANYTLGGLTCKGKIPSPDNPAQSCSTLRQAGNAHPGYYMIDSEKSRLDVVMCRMDMEETDPKFQVETSVHIAGEGGISLVDVQSTAFHLLKQGAKLWPLAGTRKDEVKAMNAVDCGSICHSLGMICNAFNWYPINFKCEFVNTLNATLQDAPGAMVYVSAFVAFSGCLTPPPSMENRTMNFSYGWNGILPAPLLSEVSYVCPRHSRCPLKAKCVGFNVWKILNQDVTPPCPGSVPLAEGYKLFQEDGRFYKYYNRYMNWTEASQVCCLDGARLASATSPTVYKAIRSVTPNPISIWQGATDELVEGTWIYEDPNEYESITFGLYH